MFQVPMKDNRLKKSCFFMRETESDEIKARRKVLKLKKCFGGLVMLLAACGTGSEPADKVVQESVVPPRSCLLNEEAPEEVKGRMTVYDAMARSVKYNTGKLSDNLREKIYADNPGITPADIINNVLNEPFSGNSLYKGVRVLDYAIMYAGAYLAEDGIAASGMIMQKAGQSLATAAVKEHGDVLHAEDQIREINKLISREQKKLAALNETYRRQGKLSSEENEYKKTIEVALVKLPEMREALVDSVIEYRRLVRNKNDKLELSGRRFYELDNFDRRVTPEIYERAALLNRPEFKSIEAGLRNYDYVSISRYLAMKYDKNKSLLINGYKVSDQMYVKSVEEQSAQAAKALINAIIAFRQNKRPEDQFALRQKIYDELAAAIFMQIEVMYDVVQVAEGDYQQNAAQLAALKKEISRMKNQKLTYVQKGELLDKELKKINLEIMRDRIMSERMAAIAGLYFYAGYQPFECLLLNGTPREIGNTLQAGFDNGRIKMFAAAENLAKEEAKQDVRHIEPVNKWAEGEDWLEKVVENKTSAEDRQWEAVPVKNSVRSSRPKAVSRPVKKTVLQPEGEFELYQGEEPDHRKIMQLGSFLEKSNIRPEWVRLKAKYPELNRFEPREDDVRMGGKLYHRLQIYSPQGGLMALCNKMRSEREQCILK